MNKKNRAREILRVLRRHYRVSGPFVHWSNPLELVVGTMLSAQCTDERVNRVTKKLFKKYRTAGEYARANLKTLEKEIYSTGFYHSKARYLKGIGTVLVRDFGGNVPGTFKELLTLPGISTKSAHLIMAKVFGQHTGVAVDTHVLRIAPRLGLTKHTIPEKIGADLEKLYSQKDYLDVNEYFITHGRAICSPGIPDCAKCPIQKLCPSAKKFIGIKKRS